MTRIACPYCHAQQEIVAPGPGETGRHPCASCGKAFAIRVPSAAGGTTQRLGGSAGTRPQSPPVTAPDAARRMGPYEIQGTIGAGGMGVVYRGWDARLNRHVAVKTLKPEVARDPEYSERFLREARAAAAVSHPNVTQIYFIGEEDGQPFIAMEFLEGKSLEALLHEEGKLPPARAIEFIRQAAAGLKAAAARGIIHRDVKPSNLVLASDGTLKVTDFGLAKLVVADAGLTMAGVVLGSPNYLAPEQASGGSVDVRSDIYSLGATLYELVTGQPPYEGPTPVSIILKHAREPLRSPRQLQPDLPVPLTMLIQRMLAKRPEDRPRDYNALLRELDRVLATSSGAETLRLGALEAAATSSSGAVSTSGASGSWILIPILILALLGGWGLARRLHAPTDPASAGSRSASTPASETSVSQTQILASVSEVTPPGLGGGAAGRRGIAIPPRLERFREAARANLQFVENSHEITSEGRLRVMGSVANTGLGNASSIQIRILLTDAAGRTIGSTEVPLTPPLLGPRQSGRFEAFFPDPHQPVNIRTELNWNS
jgi:serine/threonine protein kinase